MSYKNLTESPEKATLWIANHDSNPASAQSFQSELHPIPQLQRMMGNRNVAKLIQTKQLTPDGKIIGFQRKLTVGAADDQYEQEADRVAHQVMNTPDAVTSNSMQRAMSPEEDQEKILQTKPLAASITPFVQRQMVNNEEPEDKEKPVQAKFLTETGREALQRQPEAEEEKKETIQTKSAGSMSGNFEAGDDVETQVSHSKGRGSPLPDPVRTYMEPRFGVDFSHVRVHTGSDAVQMNRGVGAQAFTHGSDIYFGEGRYPANLELTAHELTHVVQQTGGVPLQPKKLDSQSVHREVIQPKKVPTDFGEFETSKFTEADGRGVEITLKFTPDESKVDAKKIALSQSIKSTTASGTAYAIGPNQATKMVASGKSGAGYAIDTLPGANNPLYGQDNTLGPAQNLKDTPQSANKTADATELGKNTNYDLGYCYKEKPADAAKKKHPAGLWDQPQAGKVKGVSKTFETAALAIEGTDKDKYYGSVKWGYKMEGTDAAPTVTKMDIEEASKGAPTANFIEPAKLWNAGKTPGTIKVTADPEATVLKGDASGTEKLAKDTKVKQLETNMWGTDPAIKAEVLKADGTGSGKIIYIKTADVKDTGEGGSANKKLPIPAEKPAK